MAEEALAREHDLHTRLRELLSDARYEALEQLRPRLGRSCTKPTDATPTSNRSAA